MIEVDQESAICRHFRGGGHVGDTGTPNQNYFDAAVAISLLFAGRRSYGQRSRATAYSYPVVTRQCGGRTRITGQGDKSAIEIVEYGTRSLVADVLEESRKATFHCGIYVGMPDDDDLRDWIRAGLAASDFAGDGCEFVLLVLRQQ